MIDLAVGGGGACLSELVVSGELVWNDQPGEMQVVFSEELGDGASTYRSFHLHEGPFSQRVRILTRPSGGKNKLYIWNNSQHPFKLRGFRIESVATLQGE